MPISDHFIFHSTTALKSIRHDANRWDFPLPNICLSNANGFVDLKARDGKSHSEARLMFINSNNSRFLFPLMFMKKIFSRMLRSTQENFR